MADDRMKNQEKEQGMGREGTSQQAPGRKPLDDETQGQRGGVQGSDLERDLEQESGRGISQGREGEQKRKG